MSLPSLCGYAANKAADGHLAWILLHYLGGEIVGNVALPSQLFVVLRDDVAALLAASPDISEKFAERSLAKAAYATENAAGVH